MLRIVHATRYVQPFREGGSVPALMEGDDGGLYVVKLRGAAQGAKALVAEVVAGELARAAGLAVPEVVLVEVPRALADQEPDPELADPLEASAGLNLGLDYLPGSVTFDPVVGPAPDADTASRVLLLDSFVANVDRTPRNPNLLTWHKRLWLIDHGAALYFHHGWQPTRPLEGSDDPFAESRHHVLLRWATALPDAAKALEAAFSDDVLGKVVAAVPAGWLAEDPAFAGAGEGAHRDAYRQWLRARRAQLPRLVEEAQRGRGL